MVLCPNVQFLAEFETILTSVELDKLSSAPAAASKTEGGSGKSKKEKKSGGSGAPAMQRRYRLPKEEAERIERLLQRPVDRESGKECDLNVTEDNPIGSNKHEGRKESAMTTPPRKKIKFASPCCRFQTERDYARGVFGCHLCPKIRTDNWTLPEVKVFFK